MNDDGTLSFLLVMGLVVVIATIGFLYCWLTAPVVKRFVSLRERLAQSEREREVYRRALLEIASGRKAGAVNDEHWSHAARRFIDCARKALRRARSPLPSPPEPQ